ncbi:cation:proton antiporter regulatory subunit [Candidatus Omnitrophota bacterium]
MNLMLFLIVIVVSFFVVRIGAIAFQLTGLEWSLAKFQALSCFTGTGFTTKEAELITGNPQRRRIASVLMVLGNAGLVTLVATFANTLRPAIRLPKFTIPFIHLVFPSALLPWINLAIVSVSIYILYKVFTHTKITKKITDSLKRRVIKKELVKPVSFEELLVSTGGYGVSNIEVTNESPVANKSLVETTLRSNDITVLVIERGRDIIPNPHRDTKILLGDRLVCFGKLDNIRDQLRLVAA